MTATASSSGGPIKAAIITGGDDGGGAAIAAWRLLNALELEPRARARMVAKHSARGDSRVSVFEPRRKGPLGRIADRVCSRAAHAAGLNFVAIRNFADWRTHPEVLGADVLNFHSLLEGYLNYARLPDIIGPRAAVMTLHDMWALTGHCCHSLDCERWKTGCGQCPLPWMHPQVRRDATAWEFRLKDRAYKRCAMVVAAPSRWLGDKARESPLLGRFPVRQAPYGLDTDVYRPRGKALAREALGVAPGCFAIFCCAADFSHQLKGAADMAEAVKNLPPELKSRVRLIAMGKRAALLEERAGVPVKNLGAIYNDDVKALALSAADLLLFPSMADNFPLLLQEALACGLPAVAYRVGGVPELVRDGETGLLCDPGDSRAMRDLAAKLAAGPETLRRMAEAGRRIALEEYSLEVHAKTYLGLFEEAIELRRESPASSRGRSRARPAKRGLTPTAPG